jgi:glyoxylase-like metal-dependent hydrolase (beta-lactamase superfamily II)
MKIHHLNCGTLRPYITPWLLGRGNLRNRPSLVTHCLLIETSAGLMLVDTGFGRRDYVRPSLLVRMFMTYSNYVGDINETAYNQIQNRGYDPADVQHIAITHMHLDHVGGLPDFPQAKVHIFSRELEAITQPRNIEESQVCRREHWAHTPDWQAHHLQGDQWFGLDCTPLVRFGEPLTGHTRGHSGVAVRTPQGWLLHCGDAYVYFGDVDPQEPAYPPKYKLTMQLIGIINAFRALGAHSPRLRQLLRDHGDEVRIFCSHDTYEFEQFASKQ